MLADSLRGNDPRRTASSWRFSRRVSPAVVNASGTFAANLDIGGVWPRPTLRGQPNDRRRRARPRAAWRACGSRDLNANLNFLGDSVQIDRFTVTTREERVGKLSLGGYVSLADRDNPRFDLTVGARNFHIIDRPRVAHLDVSASNLRLSGSYDRSTLTGLDHGRARDGVHSGPDRQAGHQPRQPGPLQHHRHDAHGESHAACRRRRRRS